MATQDSRKTKSELVSELKGLRGLVADLQDVQAGNEGDERYRRLVQFLPDAVRITCDGIIVYANDAAGRLFGMDSPADLIGRRAEDFVPAEERERIARRRRRLQTSGSVPMEEQKRRRLDGSELDIEVLGIRITWRGKPAVLSVLRDISSRVSGRQARVEGERRMAALAENIRAPFISA